MNKAEWLASRCPSAAKVEAAAMSPTDYLAALRTLDLTPEQAAAWLGVAKSTAYRYGTHGPHPAAATALRMALRYGLEK